MKTEPYQVAIIEDDPAQQQLVRSLLEAYEREFQVIGVASDVIAARELLIRSHPDLVILDVVLPPHDCFELLRSLDNLPFKIIFTTSHDAFAVKAFRLSAIDYLLKPLDPAEFRAALDKFRDISEGETSAARIRNMLSNIQFAEADHARIALPTLNGFLFLPVREIVRCEADNTYTTFFTTNRKKVIVSKTLKECEHQLQDLRFFRVHHSHLINLQYVVEYIKGEGGFVRMTDGSTVEVSRRRKDDFLHHLHNL